MRPGRTARLVSTTYSTPIGRSVMNEKKAPANQFHQEVRRKFPGATVVRPRWEDGSRPHVYRGIAVRSFQEAKLTLDWYRWYQIFPYCYENSGKEDKKI